MAQALRSPRISGRTEAAGQHITRSGLSQHPRHFRGRHHAATIFVVLVLAVVGFRLFPEKDVTVLSNGQSFHVSATFNQAQEALSAAGVHLDPGDRVLEGEGGRFVSLAVQRARPVVVDADGQRFTVRSQATTVGGALADTGVDLRPGDRVYLDGRLATAQGPLNARPLASLQPAELKAAATAPVSIRVERGKPMTLNVDGNRVSVVSAATTVSELLDELGMRVREGDLVRPALTDPVGAGSTVSLSKGRSILLQVDGKEQTLYTLSTTVAEVLALLEIDLGPEDTVTPNLATPVTAGMAIVISLTRHVVETAEELIPPAVQYAYDPNLAVGETRTEEGTPGLLAKTYRVTYVNGVEKAREVAGTEVIKQPIATRQISGSRTPPIIATPAPAAAANPSGGGASTVENPPPYTDGYDGPYRTRVLATVTWYTAAQGAWSPDSPYYGLTSGGYRAGYGICAVDTDYIPMHTRLYIPGYGPCIAGDTGGGIQGWTIDLGYPDGTTNSGWGFRTNYPIYILD